MKNLHKLAKSVAEELNRLNFWPVALCNSIPQMQYLFYMPNRAEVNSPKTAQPYPTHLIIYFWPHVTEY